MNRILVMFPLVLTAVVILPAGSTQEQALDSGVFQILRDSTVIGREEFALRRGRRLGTGNGFTLSSRALYPPGRPTRRVSSLIEFGPDSQPVTAQIEIADGEAKRLLVAVEPRRITVRTITPDGESARQYPATGSTLIIDQALVSSFVLISLSTTRSVAVVDPRNLRRQITELVDRGRDVTDPNPANRTLRYFTLGSGSDTRHLWFDDRGRLRKLSIPGTRITAVRADPAGS